MKQITLVKDDFDRLKTKTSQLTTMDPELESFPAVHPSLQYPLTVNLLNYLLGCVKVLIITECIERLVWYRFQIGLIEAPHAPLIFVYLSPKNLKTLTFLADCY